MPNVPVACYKSSGGAEITTGTEKPKLAYV